ncbi:MAG: M15 family metallopeptidase [Fimbriimonadaceae bacterium]
MNYCYRWAILGILLVGCGVVPKNGEKKAAGAVHEVLVKEVKQEVPRSIEVAPIVDSDMKRGDALGENDFPKEIVNQMEIVKVGYLGFDGRDHVGQLVVNRDLAEDVIALFEEIRGVDFPIVKMVPIVKYGWNDQKSMDDGNSSGFNYRMTEGPGVSGMILSKHSFGRAIDLNPCQNPFVALDGSSDHPYVPGEKGVLTADSEVVKIFKRYGWKWGGDWKGAKDYQHFEKPLQ